MTTFTTIQILGNDIDVPDFSWIKYVAIDLDGTVRAFAKKPIIVSGAEHPNSKSPRIASILVDGVLPYWCTEGFDDENAILDHIESPRV